MITKFHSYLFLFLFLDMESTFNHVSVMLLDIKRSCGSSWFFIETYGVDSET